MCNQGQGQETFADVFTSRPKNEQKTTESTALDDGDEDQLGKNNKGRLGG